MNRIIDEFGFSPKSFYTVEEYKGLNENYKPNTKTPVLGIVEGRSFVLDGVSRNGRFYPKELWENALKNPEVIQMLQDKLMFGCIGHPENYTLDDLLLEGKVSHIVTDIRIGNDGYGYATYEILDTPAGRILNTVLRAGSKMKVSTRAFGEFVNEYKEIDGRKYQVINPKNFQLESIDFVIKPGIASVDVKLVEELEKNNEEDIQKLKESKITLCEDGICTIIDEVELHNKMDEKFEKEIKKYKSIIESLKEENKNLKEEIIKKEQEENEFKNQSENELEELLIAEIENYLKNISTIKSRKDIIEAIIEFLELEEITKEDLDNLKEKLKEVDSVFVEKIIPIIEALYEKLSNNEEKNKEKILLNFGKEIEEIYIQSEFEKIKSNYESQISEYKDLIKDLSRKIVELNQKIIEKNQNEKLVKSFKEELEEKNKSIEILKNQKAQLEKKYKKLENLSVKKGEEIESLKENLNKVKQELDILKESLETKVQKKVFKQLEKEKIKIEEKIRQEEKEKFENILETKLKDLNYELKESKKQIETLSEEVAEKEKVIENLNSKKITESQKINKIEEKYITEIEQLKEENKTLFDEIRKYQIMYLKNLYKNVDEATIVETLNNIKDINKVKKVLEEKEIRQIQIPEQQIQIVKKEKEITLAEKLL